MRARRRARARVASLVGSGAPVAGPLVGGRRSGLLVVVRHTVARCVAGLGFAVDPPVDRAAARLQGGAVLLAVVVAPLSVLVGAGIGLAGWQLPRLLERRRRDRVGRELAEEALLATQLCAVAVHAGATVVEALDEVAPHLHGRLGAGLREALVAYRAGALLDVRLTAVVDDLGEPVAPLLGILRAALLDGGAVGPALGRLADRMLEERRRRVEADVRRLSVRLLVPLVCCSLPGFVLTAVVPPAVRALGDLGH